MKTELSLQSTLPGSLATLGALLILSPLLVDSLYQNQMGGLGALLLFAAWIAANLFKKEHLIDQKRWKQQVQAMIAMSLCMTLGLGMLIYYEIQMPKYRVAMTSKELYQVPPQLNKKQLFELGSECNTYGNTLCSHAVFAKIVKLDPRNFIALGNLAMAQSHLGFHKFAIHNFDTAIKNGARTYDIFKFYGHSLKALGMKKKAVAAYQSSLRLNSKQSKLVEQIRDLNQ